MPLSDADMEHLKQLARLEVSDDETAALERDLNRILKYVETLAELDADLDAGPDGGGVEPLVRPLPHENAFRDDALRPGLPRERAFELANAVEEGFFRVPRTVDEG